MLDKRFMIFIAILLSFTACIHLHQPPERLKGKLEGDAVSAVFEKSGENFDSWGRGWSVVFISHGLKNWHGLVSPMVSDFAPAPQEWVDRLSIPGVEIKNVTEAVGEDSDSIKSAFVVDKATGKKGIIFQVDKIEWISPKELHLHIWWWCGYLCGTFEVWSLSLNNGQWIDVKRIQAALH